MGQTLTLKQKSFIKNLSKGHTQTESAILAGYSSKTANVMGSQLIRKESIKKALEKVGLTEHRLALNIKRNMIAGEGIKATASDSLKATELALKLQGHLETKQEVSNITQNNYYVELKQLSEDELKQRLDSLTTEVKELE